MDNLCSERVNRLVKEVIDEVGKEHFISKKFIDEKRKELMRLHQFFFDNELYKIEMLSHFIATYSMAKDIIEIVDSYRGGLNVGKKLRL